MENIILIFTFILAIVFFLVMFGFVLIVALPEIRDAIDDIRYRRKLKKERKHEQMDLHNNHRL